MLLSAVFITVFYIYYFLALNIYRKELHFRFIAYKNVYGKDKAPLSIKKTVLLLSVILLFNISIQVLLSPNVLILIHALPVMTLMYHLRYLRRKIAKFDNENEN